MPTCPSRLTVPPPAAAAFAAALAALRFSLSLAACRFSCRTRSASLSESDPDDTAGLPGGLTLPQDCSSTPPPPHMASSFAIASAARFLSACAWGYPCTHSVDTTASGRAMRCVCASIVLSRSRSRGLGLQLARMPQAGDSTGLFAAPLRAEYRSSTDAFRMQGVGFKGAGFRV